PRATARIGCSARTRPSCCRWRVERGTVELHHSVEEPRVADEVIEHLPARFGHRTIVSRREGNAEDAKRRGHGRTVDLDAGSVQAADDVLVAADDRGRRVERSEVIDAL